MDPCAPTTVLDAFDRPDGRIGESWRGATSPIFYRIAAHRLAVILGGAITWNPTVFGADQAAFVTLAKVDPHSPSQGVLLKVQSGGLPDAGAIAVVYDAWSRAVRVTAIRVGAREWTWVGNVPAHFGDGDKLGACARASGEVRIYKNGAFLDSLTLNAADRRFFAARGGKLGVWSAFASRAVMDDFGGGTIAP